MATGSGEFARYYAARYRALRRTAYLLSGDWHEAEDLTQAAFVRLYLAWRRVRADGAHAYARRVLLNEFLGRRRRNHEHSVEDLPQLAVPGDSPEDRVDLAAALRAVPPQQRAVVVLRYWEGLSVGQTAHLLGIAEGTVKSQAARGLAALRTHLTPAVDPRIRP